jgi:cysteine-rich secretory family protein
MTTSPRLRIGFGLIAISFSLGLGCNALTGIGDLSVEETGGAGGTTVSTVAGGDTVAATTVGVGGAPVGGTSATSAVSATSTSAGTTSAATSSAASTSAASSTAASSSAASSSAATTGGGGTDPTQLCVDDINAFRATLGLPPYARWNAEESCAGDEAGKDAAANQAHSAFGQCGEFAQDECPGWPGPPGSMIGNCLQMMWDEGPGAFDQGHGHYINMSSTQYTKVACGFHVLANGKVWATQDFK